MPVLDTKDIAIAAARAQNAITQLREAVEYFGDRHLEPADYVDRDEDTGEYATFTDAELAAIDGGATDALAALAERDAEIAEEEQAARDEVDAMNNAATDGDESNSVDEGGDTAQ